MEQIDIKIAQLEAEYASIDTSLEDREYTRMERLFNEAIANKNEKQNQKNAILKKLEEWQSIKEKINALIEEQQEEVE